MRILVTGARAPAAAHIARLLSDAGAQVHAADCLAFPLTLGARGISATHRHPSPRHQYEDFRDWLACFLEGQRIDFVVPTCEEVLYLSRALEDIGRSSVLAAPRHSLIVEQHDKYAFVQGLAKAGIEAPETHLLLSQDDVRPLMRARRHLVFKPVFSRFGRRTLVAPFRQPLSQIIPSPSDPWVAQELLHGEEVCVYAVGREGRVSGVVAYRPLHRAGVGAGICFEPSRLPAARDLAEAFFAATSWTGQVSFDCMLTSDRGLVPFECNPRATSGVHFIENGTSFLDALIGEGEVNAISEALKITPAMLTYGLGAAIIDGRIQGWWRDMRRARSATAYGRVPALSALACFSEIAWRGLKRGMSPITSSTWDLEWDGDATRAQRT